MLHKELRRLEHGKTIFFQRKKAIIHRNSIQFAVTDIISQFLLSLVIIKVESRVIASHHQIVSSIEHTGTFFLQQVHSKIIL